MRRRVLIVGGSDSGGGAGIQADIKTVIALGGYAATAITALTVQDTQGVSGVHTLQPDFVAAQMRAVLDDIGADCIKTGMLCSASVLETVAEVVRGRDLPMVVDPVMAAKGGAALLELGAADALLRYLAPLATVLTPNIPEAEALLGHRVRDPDAMAQAARELCDLGPGAVLLKGGHLPGEQLWDVLVDATEVHYFEGPRLQTRHTHGTGCTLASAIATGLAQGIPLVEAVRRARDYLREAIRTAPGLGRGHGPVNHGHTVRPFP